MRYEPRAEGPGPERAAFADALLPWRKDLDLERVARVLRRTGSTPRWLVWVPGRVEFLGKHTDYAGGRSLVCPIDRGFMLAVAPRTDERLLMTDAGGIDDTYVCPLAPDTPIYAGHWSAYIATVARRVARNFPGVRGADVAFLSDLPPAAGMSSSSALMIGTFLALSAVNDLPARPEYRAAIRSPEELAGYLGTIENGQGFPGLAGDSGVGTFGGSEDHTALICGSSGVLVQYSYAPVRFERLVPLPADHVLVVAASGVAAEKTGAAREHYNALSLMSAELLGLWRTDTGRDDVTLAAAVASSPGAAGRLRDIVAALVAETAATGFDAGPGPFTGAALSARLEHFLLESEELVPAGGDALERGKLGELGRIAELSQAGAERLLRNQVPETTWLARSARELGALAASSFGAGFGGSVWALVPDRRAAALTERWRGEYLQVFPRRAQQAAFFPTVAGTPAGIAAWP